jgi:TfoX/Sxy family transcriptional regulator of competence genes
MNSKPDLLSRVRSALADVPDVTEKRMFGSLGFLVRGKLCVSYRPERIMCRIGPTQHEKALEQAGCTTVVMRGRECPGYVYVAADTLKTDRAVKRWIALALAHNATLP